LVSFPHFLGTLFRYLKRGQLNETKTFLKIVFPDIDTQVARGFVLKICLKKWDNTHISSHQKTPPTAYKSKNFHEIIKTKGRDNNEKKIKNSNQKHAKTSFKT